MTEDEFFGEGDGANDASDPEVDVEAPPPVGKGAVAGTLTSRDSLPVIDAQVTVLGAPEKAFTDIGGRFRLELPPGRYNIRFFSPGYDPVQLQGVLVTTGETTVLEPSFRGDVEENLVESLEVEVEADVSSLEGQLLTRKRSLSVGDGIGRAEIARTPDRDAAAAARRVVGVLIVDGKYVYVRGIGERYTNALLDGSPLPSPEPEQQTVPLDLFPTSVLDSLTVVKTFTPDMVGNFAGGSVRIGTRRLPEKFTFSISGSLGFNSQTTFQEYLQYRGGDLDWAGIDDGTRALPNDIPPYRVGNLRKPDGTFFTPEELQAHGRSINAYMSSQRKLAPVDHRFSVTVGNTFDLADDQKLGVQLAASYGRSFERRPAERLRTFFADSDGGLLLRNDLTLERGIDQVAWSVLGGVTYQPSKAHRVHLTGLYSISSDNEAFEVEGPHAERSAPIHETRLSFRSRNLIFGQLRGEHDFDDLAGARLDWNASVSRAYRDQPDTRATVFQFDSSRGYAFEDDSQSGWHFFSELEEMVYGGGLDWAQPLALGSSDHKVKLGTRFDRRERGFHARRFRFRPTATAPTCEVFEWDPSCPDQIFAGDNIGPVFFLDENTLPADAYDASLDVYAAYAMADLQLAKSLRLVAGPRLEVATQRIHVFDQFAPDDATQFRDARITGKDLLAGGALIWEVAESMNLRLAASRTVARPQLREIAPFSYTNYFGGFQEQGNPDLVFTQIYNGDLRWEWFPSAREVLAASFFVKRFENPIEQIIVPSSTGLITYQNTPGADLIGGEVEARKSLGFVAPALDDLALIANLTLAFSRVDLGDVDFLTSAERPLVNQAPWIVNAAIDYDNEDIGFQARLLYNIIGKRIIQVGARNLPDVYEQPRHQLDLTLAQRVLEGLRVSLSGKNLVNDDLRATYGKEDVEANLHRQYRTGIEASLGASYTY